MPAPPHPAVAIETLGDTAVVVRLGNAPDGRTLRRVAAARERIERAALAGVVDVAATFTTVAVWLDPERTDAARVAAALAGCLAGGVDAPLAAPRCFDIPVIYGGA
ncbi:MAG: carboxyltransferase domain-containing protein, partial [Planctomycetaceae bacterium]